MQKKVNDSERKSFSAGLAATLVVDFDESLNAASSDNLIDFRKDKDGTLTVVSDDENCKNADEYCNRYSMSWLSLEGEEGEKEDDDENQPKTNPDTQFLHQSKLPPDWFKTPPDSCLSASKPIPQTKTKKMPMPTLAQLLLSLKPRTIQAEKQTDDV